MSSVTQAGLSFVLPIRNQGAILEAAFSAWITVLDRLGRPIEIIIIDDGSTDETAEILNKPLFQESGNKPNRTIKVIQNPTPEGFGACLRSALKVASQTYFFYTGLDERYTPSDLRKLLERIEKTDPEFPVQIHVVNGYRCLKPVPYVWRFLGQIKRIFLRVSMNLPSEPLSGWLGLKAHCYQRLMRTLFGVRIVDLQSKFKLFRREIFDRIPIQSNSEFVHLEILAKANFLTCFMDEIPIAEKEGPFVSLRLSKDQTSIRGDFYNVLSKPQFTRANPTGVNQEAYLQTIPDVPLTSSESV